MTIYHQVCSNTVGWTVVEVDSESHPGTVYTVVISDWDYLCDCKGFEFSGKCKHKAVADQLRCKWEEGSAPCQSLLERKTHTCPLCGAPTVLVPESNLDDEQST